MLTFDAGSFSDISDTRLGRDLWKFLNGTDAVLILETATYLRRPALEGLQPRLLNRFGDDIRGDRWKQMIGRMVRQIMETHGYQLDQSRVLIRVGDLFTSASRYAKQSAA